MKYLELSTADYFRLLVGRIAGSEVYVCSSGS